MKARIFLSNWFFYTAIFVFFVVFFFKVHPIAPYDTDDWLFMGIERPSYPSLYCWNPSKVLPERLEPFVSIVGGYLIVPLVGDYIRGIILTNAIVVSLFVIIYLLLLHRYLEANFSLGRLTSLAIIVVFTVMHFLILRTMEENNDYLWYTHDASCYYHYVIPSLLNASLVLWFLRYDFRFENSGRTIALLIAFIYLALCSNLYSSVILIAYIGSILVLDIIRPNSQNLKTSESYKGWLRNYIHRNIRYLLITICWGVIQWFEANGTRANGFGYLHEPMVYCLKVSIYNFITISYNHWFLVISLLAFIGAKCWDYKRNRHGLWHIGFRQWVILLSLGFSIAYLILLSSRVDPTYIQRSDVIFAYAFFFLLLVAHALAYLCKQHRFVAITMPLLIVVLFFLTNTRGKTFKDVIEEYEPNLQTCLAIDHDIVQQILDADAARLDSVSIDVPTYSKHSYNWPIMVTDYASQYYGHALYLHNQTKREIKTRFIPTYVID